MTQPGARPATKYRTREEWLEAAVEEFRGTFEQIGYPLPERVHVSCGWGYGKAHAESKDVAGQCWSGTQSADSAPHVFISPMLHDPVEVLGTLVHELIHAAIDPDMSHGKEFKEAATALGLVGPMRSTVPDLMTGLEYGNLAAADGALGPYPHAPIELLPSLAVNDPAARPVVAVGGGTTATGRATTAPAPQVSRWVNVRCPRCPSPTGRGQRVAKVSRSTFEEGAPLCGRRDPESGVVCTEPMVADH